MAAAAHRLSPYCGYLHLFLGAVAVAELPVIGWRAGVAKARLRCSTINRAGQERLALEDP
jgi:hypothetical protein